jgi:hypothetical protein
MRGLTEPSGLDIDTGKLGKEVDVGDLDIVEDGRAVVGHGVSGFRADVHDCAAGEELARLGVAQGDDEGVGAAADERAVLAVLRAETNNLVNRVKSEGREKSAKRTGV